MIFVPLPFVVALLLLLLLIAVWRRQDDPRITQPFLALIALCMVQSIVLGLRWAYGFDMLRYVLPLIASCVPPLVYLGFSSLVGPERRSFSWEHAAAPVVMLLLVAVAPSLIDIALVVIFVGYAFAVYRLGRSGPDALGEARLDAAVPAHRALMLAAISLCVSASFDIAVWLDFAWTKGANVKLMVTNANVLGLLLIGITAIVAERARPGASASSSSETGRPVSEQDRDVLARVDLILTEQKLYRDDNLSLARLARRAGLPARQISEAINRLSGKNVSQYINDARIAEACRLLRDTDVSVTAAMLDAGFQTKSNFNREFRRVTSLSPAAWREKNRPR